MFLGIEHFAIASLSPQQLAEWYVSTLGFSLVCERSGNYFVEAANGVIIEIIPGEGEHGSPGLRTPGMRHIAIAVNNFDAAHTQLRRSGVRFSGEPFRNGRNRLVFFEDPDGNALHLIERHDSLSPSDSTVVS